MAETHELSVISAKDEPVEEARVAQIQEDGEPLSIERDQGGSRSMTAEPGAAGSLAKSDSFFDGTRESSEREAVKNEQLKRLSDRPVLGFVHPDFGNVDPVTGEFTRVRLERRESMARYLEAPCLIASQSKVSSYVDRYFPEVEWKKDLWAFHGLNPINESLRKHGHSLLTFNELIQLQKALVFASLMFERLSGEDLTWKNFVEPFLLLSGEKLRWLIGLAERVLGPPGSTCYGTELGIVSAFDGRHAIILCWIAVEAAYGSNMSFRDYIREFFDKDSLERYQHQAQAGLGFSLYDFLSYAAGLTCPYQKDRSFAGDSSIKDFLGTRMKDYPAVIGMHNISSDDIEIRDLPFQPSKSPSFRPREASLPYISKGTNLRVVWCHHLDMHLWMGRNDGHIYYLSLYWPCYTGFILSQLTRINHLNQTCSKLTSELFDTYAILFTSSGDVQEDLRCYSNLGVPEWRRTTNSSRIFRKYLPWLYWYFKYRMFTRKVRLENDFVASRPFHEDQDVRGHLGNGFALNRSRRNFAAKSSIPFERFPFFAARLRVLKGFIDQQEPSGVRQLWRDTRNKKEWYTFWAVIIIGGVGLIFAAASFAVSTAQTAATFQALQLQLHPPSQTSSAP